MCKGYLPTDLADEDERKMSWAECCDCRCHLTFSNPDGTAREDADALRAEALSLALESAVVLKLRANGQLN